MKPVFPQLQNGGALASPLQRYVSNQLLTLTSRALMEEHALHIVAFTSFASQEGITLVTINHSTLLHQLGQPTSTDLSIEFLLAIANIYTTLTRNPVEPSTKVVSLSHTTFMCCCTNSSPFTLCCDWFLKRCTITDFVSSYLTRFPNPLLHDSPPIPHLSQVQVALNPQE